MTVVKVEDVVRTRRREGEETVGRKGMPDDGASPVL